MVDEPKVEPGEPTPTEPVQEPQEPEPQVQEPQEPGELDVLRGQVSNLEKVLGDQGRTIGDLKNDNAFLRSQGNQGQNQGQQQPHPQNPAMGSPVGNAPEYDPYDADSVKQYSAYQQSVMDDKLNRFAGYVQNAVMTGDAMSKVREIVNSDPENFKGIEQETVNMVSNLAKTGTVDPKLIQDPTTVYGVADMVKGYKQREKANPVMPVAPTAIDTPAPVRPNEPEKQLDTGIAKEIVDTFYGGNLELATKGARASKARGEK